MSALRAIDWCIDAYSDREIEGSTLFEFENIRGRIWPNGFYGNTVIALAGTNDVSDWCCNNLRFLKTSCEYGGSVHRGFCYYASSCWQAIHQIHSNLHFKNSIIVGHSLGGAAAVLLAEKIYNKYYEAPIVITFGQPRVGDRNFAQKYPCQISIRRFVNAGDVVPLLPLPGILFRYCHINEKMKLPRDNLASYLPWNFVKNHSTGEYKRRLQKKYNHVISTNSDRLC